MHESNTMVIILTSLFIHNQIKAHLYRSRVEKSIRIFLSEQLYDKDRGEL